MKLKHALLIFLAGFVVTTLGALFKLESWEFASELLIVGLSLKLIGGIRFFDECFAHGCLILLQGLFTTELSG